jgi:hypothetical protein
MKRYIFLFPLSLLAVSCAFHSGNVSTGADIDCPRKYIVYGSASTFKFLGLGGLDSDGLIKDAKVNLYQSIPQTRGLKLTNFAVDFKTTFLILFITTKATVSADLYDCNGSFEEQSIHSQKSKSDTIDISKNGFKIGDTVIYVSDNDLFDIQKPAKILFFLKNNKVVIQLNDLSLNPKTKKVFFDQIFKTTQALNNKVNFGYEIGDYTNIHIYNSITNKRSLKDCKIIAINKHKAIIEFVKEDGSKKNTIVELDQLQK